jgi:hypothetical protein
VFEVMMGKRDELGRRFFISSVGFYVYRDLWVWINRPFETPPEPAAQLELKLDSSGAGG